MKIFSIEETDSLEIQITDDGIGMSDEMLKQMNAYEQTKKNEEICSPEQMHIGIANLQRRLRYFYGEDCRIVFSNREEGGLSVVIRMKCTVSHGNKTKKWTGA